MDLIALVETLHDIRTKKAALEKIEKDLVIQLKPMVDQDFDTDPETKLEVGSLLVMRIPGKTTSISGEKLLERGVSPEIVAYATRTTPYFQYRIKEAKSASTDG